MEKILYVALVAVLSINLITGLSASAITTIYSVTADTNDQALGTSVGNFEFSRYAKAVAEKIEAGSPLIGQQINYIDVAVVKQGTPQGRVFGTIFDSNVNIKQSCGNIKTSDITGNGQTVFLHFSCAQPYTIQEGDRIGIRYTHPQTDENSRLETFVGSDGNDVVANAVREYSPDGTSWTSANATATADMSLRFGME